MKHIVTLTDGYGQRAIVLLNSGLALFQVVDANAIVLVQNLFQGCFDSRKVDRSYSRNKAKIPSCRCCSKISRLFRFAEG